jgi:hypothetical protein
MSWPLGEGDFRKLGDEFFSYVLQYGDLVTIDPQILERAVAIRWSDWESAFRATQLETARDVIWVNWCGRQNRPNT